MRPDDLRRGFHEEDAPYLANYRQMARANGWSAAQIAAAEDWYLAQRNFKDTDALTDSWLNHAAQNGLPEIEADIALSWHSQVADGSIDVSQVPQSTRPMAEIEAEIAELQQRMKDDYHGYMRDESARNRMYDLLNEKLTGEAAPPPPTANEARKAEIQSYMRSNYSDYMRNEPMRQEYLDILRAETGEAAPVAPTHSGGIPVETGGADVSGE